jgi:dihydroorotase
LELYAHVFDELDALDKLEGFSSHHGADFYGLPRNAGTVTLVKENWQVPDQTILPNGEPIVPFYAGQQVTWRIKV